MVDRSTFSEGNSQSEETLVTSGVFNTHKKSILRANQMPARHLSPRTDGIKPNRVGKDTDVHGDAITSLQPLASLLVFYYSVA
jgi:hypothetical protein